MESLLSSQTGAKSSVSRANEHPVSFVASDEGERKERGEEAGMDGSPGREQLLAQRVIHVVATKRADEEQMVTKREPLD
jgi:hypothetical protein